MKKILRKLLAVVLCMALAVSNVTVTLADFSSLAGGEKVSELFDAKESEEEVAEDEVAEEGLQAY